MPEHQSILSLNCIALSRIVQNAYACILALAEGPKSMSRILNSFIREAVRIGAAATACASIAAVVFVSREM